jgi:hypothetical protein
MKEAEIMSAQPAAKEVPVLTPTVPVDWLWMPKPLRLTLAWVSLTLFSASFYALPACVVLLFPMTWRYAPKLAGAYLTAVIVAMTWPFGCEWPLARKFFQLWYEVFQMQTNYTEEKQKELYDHVDKYQCILCMHPHGVIPFQGLLWAAFCDQYVPGTYGFGAVADVVEYIPFVRNVLAWLTTSSASYKLLRDGLVDGKCKSCNRVGRKPKHLFILPGGIAEIFTSTPGREAIILKSRKGLVKLSIETGASLCPLYVFGVADYFNNFATHGGFLSSISRKMRMSLTLFWGQYWLPIPFPARTVMCFGDPILVEKWTGEGPIPQALIDEVHAKYVSSLVEIFEKYKEVAGYGGRELEVL